MKTLIIAEAGVNHNGSLELAERLADQAKKAGADFVKFQVGIPELIAAKCATKAEYQEKTTGKNETQLEMIRKISLTFDEHRKLAQYCQRIGIAYLCTPFDLPSIHFLQSLGTPFWKVPSGEITNFPYLRAIGETQKPVILSTGMADMDEIEQSLDVLTRFGTQKEHITLLHCTTEYPTPKNEVNLMALQSLREHFGLRVGYSDHTQGLEIPVAAATMGACVIEKHFTLDRTMEGPDHKASLEPHELKLMVEYIRNVESAIGNGFKKAMPSEVKNREIARKSILAARRIKAGERLTEENLITKRPGNGLSPMLWETVIGTKAVKDFEPDEPIRL